MTTPTIAVDVTDATFTAEVLERSASMPVVVDFWAPWCGPCRILGPIIEKVAGEMAGEVLLAKLNTDENPRTATQYRIQGIPAVKAFRNGAVAGEFTGALPESQVRAFFQKLAPSPAERAAAKASELARSGNVAQAEEQFREVLRAAPSHADAVVGLAGLLIERGEHEEAESLLGRVPTDRRAKVLKHRLFLQSFAAKHGREDLDGAVAANPGEARARYRWGVMLAAKGEYEAALDQLLESVRLDRAFADGAARKAVLAVFDILGLESPITRDYQRRLSSILF